MILTQARKRIHDRTVNGNEIKSNQMHNDLRWPRTSNIHKKIINMDAKIHVKANFAFTKEYSKSISLTEQLPKIHASRR